MLIRHIDKEVWVDGVEIMNFDMTERLYLLNHHLISNRGLRLWVRVDDQHLWHDFVCRGVLLIPLKHSFEG